MLQQSLSMQDGSLGAINTVEHCIELILGTLPFAKELYRSGPKAKELRVTEVHKMSEAGVIGLSKSSWSAQLVLISRPDGTIWSFVDYRKLNGSQVYLLIANGR